MPQPRTTMRKTKEILRLKLHCNLSVRQIATSVKASNGKVSDVINRAKAANLSWPLASDLNDETVLNGRGLSAGDLSPTSIYKSRMDERVELGKELLPQSILLETSRTYADIAEKITGKAIQISNDPKSEIITILKNEYGLID